MGNSADGVEPGERSVRLDNRQAHRSDPSNWTVVLSDKFCATNEPFLDVMGSCEKIRDGLESEGSHINTCFVAFIFCKEVLIFELTMNLLSGTYEGDTVDTGHDCLLDGFTLDILLKFGGQLTIRVIRVINGFF